MLCKLFGIQGWVSLYSISKVEAVVETLGIKLNFQTLKPVIEECLANGRTSYSKFLVQLIHDKLISELTKYGLKVVKNEIEDETGECGIFAYGSLVFEIPDIQVLYRVLDNFYLFKEVSEILWGIELLNINIKLWCGKEMSLKRFIVEVETWKDSYSKQVTLAEYLCEL
jgi:hypothetical protein